MIYKVPAGDTTDAERRMLRRLRVWIAALALACLAVGASLGAALTSMPSTPAQQPAASAPEIARAPEALSASFAEIARRVEPAVVKINTVTERTERMGEEGDEEDTDPDAPENPNGKDAPADPLSELFRRQMRPELAPRGVGSGFIVDPSGIIITNQHVVEGATRIKVRLDSGEELYGRVVGSDEETDLAIVRVETKRPLPVARLGDSDSVETGDWVLAIGSPFDFDRTVTAGIISAKEREAPGMNLVRFLQTDAAINRGNSGGPLVNMRGEVIGVNSQIATTTGDYNGIGFALPSNQTEFVYKQIMSAGKVRRGYLGINLETVRGEFARIYNLQEARGAIVENVRDKDGPAGSAGIEPGDIIVEFGGAQVTTAQDLIARVAATQVNQVISVVYLRDINSKLERRTAQVRIGERPSPSSALRGGGGRSTPPDAVPVTPPTPRTGLKTSELTPQLAVDIGLSRDARGLVVSEVTPGSVWDDAGLKTNMTIRRVNRTNVLTNAELKRIIDNLKPGDPVVMVVATPGGGGRTLDSILQFTFQ